MINLINILLIVNIVLIALELFFRNQQEPLKKIPFGDLDTLLIDPNENLELKLRQSPITIFTYLFITTPRVSIRYTHIPGYPSGQLLDITVVGYENLLLSFENNKLTHYCDDSHYQEEPAQDIPETDRLAAERLLKNRVQNLFIQELQKVRAPQV